NNIVPGDVNGVDDIFALDRVTNAVLLISISNLGLSADGPSGFVAMSSDGFTVAFGSQATNLVQDDNNGVDDIFVSNPLTGDIKRISVSGSGDEANGPSFLPSVSGDGRFVAFQSAASNLVPNDNNGVADIFVYDLLTDDIQRISVDNAGNEGNDESLNPSVSNDGSFISFRSSADNLVPGDTNGSTDVFVYNRLSDTIERVSVSSEGAESNGNSFSFPRSISADGRFIAFISDAANLAGGDQNDSIDSFVHDRVTGVTTRVSTSAEGVEADGGTLNTSISADGRTIALTSLATNLIPDDNNAFADVFVTANPLAVAGQSHDVEAGDLLTEFNLGLVPNPGSLSGRLFEDVVPNAVFDSGETPLSDVIVFLDENQNQVFDNGEMFTTSQADGRYEFPVVPSFRDYTIAVQVPVGWEQVSPGPQQSFVWDVFLPAGGAVGGRDFGLQRVSGTGQSRLSSVSGRLFDDKNANGIFDAGDAPLPETVVFLDQQNFGVRDANEPAVETDAEGRYSID
ncbi:MAG: hypothetical protein MI861_04365, partial [Pirellulales bacterium]|nr:hypothetical protein [Pirellulales bacterium]